MLRKLAGKTCQVPRSYLVGRWTRYTVKKEIIASGGFADIREGKLGKKVVAVRSIRVTREIDADAIHKVSDVAARRLAMRHTGSRPSAKNVFCG